MPDSDIDQASRSAIGSIRVNVGFIETKSKTVLTYNMAKQTTQQDKQTKSQRWKELSDAQATVIAAFIALCPPIISGGITAIATIHIIKRDLDPLEQARQRLISALPSRPGFSKQVYPAFGFGFLTPASWSIEDAAARFGGGEVDCIKRYEDTKGIVGVKFRLRTVQKNYINDIGAELQNQIDVWKLIDPNLRSETSPSTRSQLRLLRTTSPPVGALVTSTSTGCVSHRR